MEQIETDAQQKKTCRKVYCPGCGRYFVSERFHALHRAGTYRTSEHAGTRRCLSDTELQEQGMATEVRRVRFLTGTKKWVATHPVWFSPVEREEVRARFALLGKDRDEEDDPAAT